MHLPSFLVPLFHLLGIGTGSDSETTTISTVDGYFSTRLTTPVFNNPSVFAEDHSTPVSPKFLSTLASTYSTAEELIDRSKLSSGNTREFRTTKDDVSSTTLTAETGGSTTNSGTTETGSHTETDPTGGSTITSGTTETGSNTETDSGNATDSGNTTITGSTQPDTTVTGSDTTITGSDTTVTGSDTTITGSIEPDTTVSGNTGPDTTVSGSTGTGASSPPTGSTDPPPTQAPGLSRGAVAGIVIGCLLLVAVVAAAVVFFMKNRNIPPEAQRLRI